MKYFILKANTSDKLVHNSNKLSFDNFEEAYDNFKLLAINCSYDKMYLIADFCNTNKNLLHRINSNTDELNYIMLYSYDNESKTITSYNNTMHVFTDGFERVFIDNSSCIKVLENIVKSKKAANVRATLSKDNKALDKNLASRNIGSKSNSKKYILYPSMMA